MIGVTFLGEALKQVKPQDGKLSVPELAKALEKVTYTSPLGTYTMRAEDHQVQLPMVVSKVGKNAKYKADDTDMGFEPVRC